MNKVALGVVLAGVLALGLAFRLADLRARPMHHDEANQAVRFGILLETGEYRYDRQDHHGPTLYYLTLPFAWLQGQRTLALLDERTVRMVPAVFGAGLLVLFFLLAGPTDAPSSRGIGRVAAVAAATLAAISPVLTYYSRFYIQETLLVFFVIAFAIAIGRYRARPRMASAISAGVFAGLAYATKETSLILLPALVAACGIASRLARNDRGGSGHPANAGWQSRVQHLLAAVSAALLVALVFYTGFFTNPAGLFDSLGAVSIYLSRGVEPGPHVAPWFTYLQTLAWSAAGGLVWTEALVLILAAVGIVHAVAARRFWPLYIGLYAIGAGAIFSTVPYKTPWNVAPFYAGLVLMAGIGVQQLFEWARPRAARVLVALVLVAAAWQLGAQNVRASVQYAADARNPYAYAHTSADYLRLAARVHDLAAQHPDRSRMLVKVVAGPYDQWPFPWYARDLTRVGYWNRAADAGAFTGVPVILASAENAADVDTAVGDGYVSEFYGLRPGVLLTLYVERNLWNQFMESRR